MVRLRVVFEHHDREETGYAVILAEPASGIVLGLHHHTNGARDLFDEGRTGLDHIAFSVPTRDNLDAWVRRLDERHRTHRSSATSPSRPRSRRSCSGIRTTSSSNSCTKADTHTAAGRAPLRRARDGVPISAVTLVQPRSWVGHVGGDTGAPKAQDAPLRYLESLTVAQMEEIVFSVVDPASPAARSVLTGYFAELDERFAGGFDVDQALTDAVETFQPPEGLFVVATSPDGPVACGAVQYLDAETAEIKRMWVSPQTRGLGMGKRLLAHLEREIVESGRSTAILDTNASLTEAIAMYRACGYAAIERYNDNPYAQLWFSKALRRH